MKWIGQHIWDFVSRFRGDVYIENVTESAQDHVVGIDANGKLYKQDVSTGDITGVTAGTGLNGGGSSGAVTLNVDAAQTNVTSLGTLTNLDVDNININGDTITASADLSIVATGNDIAIDTDNLVIESATSGKPFVELKSTTNDSKGSTIQFTSDKGAAGVDGDSIGTILFVGDDDHPSQQQTSYAAIIGRVSDASNTDEAGKLQFQVAESDGTTTALTTGLLIEGEHATDGEVDVTIAAGATSTTTVSGTLTARETTVTNLITSGNIELGHADDTTLARSAAGKVTIQGNEIQTTNVHRHFINFGVNIQFPYARYIPIGSYYILEQNTDANPEYTTYVVPYDGRIVKAILRSEEVLGNTSLTFFKVSDGTEEPDAGTTMDTKTVDIAAANTAYTYTFDVDSDAAFTKGQALSLKIDPTDDPSAAGVVGTIEFEFDLTT